MDNFVHLHNHSEYSLLDGACRIKDLARAAKEEGQSAVAITDHGVMYGAVSFYNACKAEGVKPIIGCEVYVAPKSRFDKNRVGEDAYYHLVLLCKNEIGYKNLIYLVSCGFTEGFYVKPRIDNELLRQHSEGLICLSGCLSGYIPRMLYRGEEEKAYEYAVFLRDLFGKDDFYIELQEHGIEAEEEILPKLVALAEKADVQLVATNDVHYIEKKDAKTQKVLMCIQTNTSVSSDDVGFETDEFYFKSGNMMRNIFSFCPTACANTAKIAEKCNFEFDFSNIYLPSYEAPSGFDTYTYLRHLTEEGMKRRIAQGQIPGGKEYTDRVEYELSVIHKMGFDDYYLIVADYVGYAKRSGIGTGPGRGSGAGSLVAYFVGITDIDPIKYGLMFERFLNPERVSMPDFDVDFADERRPEVISYVTDKYGRDRVSQIVTFNTLAARAAVRDCGRALGMSYGSVDVVAKLIPNRLKITIKEALEGIDGKELKALYDSDENVRILIDTAAAVEGMPRNISTHAAGVVITKDPVSSYVPLSSSGDMILTQYDMDDISSLGLVKFDFLGIKYLTIIENAQKLIKQKYPDFNPDELTIDDEKTYKMISEGDTDGIFQLESEGMKKMLTKLCPSNIEDIIAAIALYRPGPMDSIPKYIENRKNPEKIEYISPLLEDTLSTTYGVVVYQEQVMQIFRILAGYSYGRADVVRRLMSKKKSELMQKQREIFLYGEKDESGETIIPGALANGISKADANRLFDELEGFAKYAFNKSHAACYAFVTYRTAYLKCNYYAEYMASLLTNELGNLSKTALYISLCQKKGISVLPPDINESGTQYTVVYADGKPCIRYGLGAIKNVGINFTQSIIKERAKRPFSDFCDFVSRMIKYDGNKKQLEPLIKCGAFDLLGVYRSKLLASYETIVENEMSVSRSNVSGQINLFSDVDSGSEIKGEFKYPDIPEFSLRDMLTLEKEATGMYFSGHMLDEYSKNISDIKCEQISSVVSDTESETKRTVTICGMIVSVTKKETKNGGIMAFATIEDRYAQIEVLIFPKQFSQVQYLIMPDTAVCITGEVSVREGEEPKILVSTVFRLENNAQYQKRTVKKEKTLYLSVPEKDGEIMKKALALANIYVDENAQTPYCIFCRDTGKYYKYNAKITLTELLVRRLKELLGEDSVVYK